MDTRNVMANALRPTQCFLYNMGYRVRLFALIPTSCSLLLIVVYMDLSICTNSGCREITKQSYILLVARCQPPQYFILALPV